MTLPITDSMLRGELRPNILAELKDHQEISSLWGILYKWDNSGDGSLRGIEKALVDAVENSGLVKVSEIYNDDREMRQGAEMAREKGYCPTILTSHGWMSRSAWMGFSPPSSRLPPLTASATSCSNWNAGAL